MINVLKHLSVAAEYAHKANKGSENVSSYLSVKPRHLQIQTMGKDPHRKFPFEWKINFSWEEIEVHLLRGELDRALVSAIDEGRRRVINLMEGTYDRRRPENSLRY